MDKSVSITRESKREEKIRRFFDILRHGDSSTDLYGLQHHPGYSDIVYDDELLNLMFELPENDRVEVLENYIYHLSDEPWDDKHIFGQLKLLCRIATEVPSEWELLDGQNVYIDVINNIEYPTHEHREYFEILFQCGFRFGNEGCIPLETQKMLIGVGYTDVNEELEYGSESSFEVEDHDGDNTYMNRISCREFLLNYLNYVSNKKNLIRAPVDRLEMFEILTLKLVCSTLMSMEEALPYFGIGRDIKRQDVFEPKQTTHPDLGNVVRFYDILGQTMIDKTPFPPIMVDIAERIFLRKHISQQMMDMFLPESGLTSTLVHFMVKLVPECEQHLVQNQWTYYRNEILDYLSDEDLVIVTFPQSFRVFHVPYDFYPLTMYDTITNNMMFALIVCICDGYLEVPSNAPVNIKRFFNIMSRLNMDIQLRMFGIKGMCPDYAFAMALTDPRMGFLILRNPVKNNSWVGPPNFTTQNGNINQDGW